MTTTQVTYYPTAVDAVKAFMKARLEDTSENGSAFTADHLRNFVNTTVKKGVSPSSTDRVLRMLRQSGKLDYTVENRGLSLYRARPLGTTHA